MRGWVYFIRSGETGPIKIGWAVDPRRRLRTLACGSPCELILLGALLCEQAEAEEYSLHARLRAYRVRGEWFEAVAVLREIQNLGERVLSPEEIFRRSGESCQSLDNQALRSHQLTVRIPQRIRDALDEAATAARCSVADIVNDLLEEYFESVDSDRTTP